MKVIICSIFDSKAKAYGQPFFQINSEVAMRTVVDLVSDPKSNFHRHPADFTLFKFGTFDDVNGVFDIEATPIPLYHFHEIQAELNLS